MHLDNDIQYLKGVGPSRAADFHSLDITTVRDLLFTFPRALSDRSNVTTIADAPAEGEAVVVAQLRNIEEKKMRGGRVRSRVHAMFIDGTGELEAVWFNAPWVKEQLTVGSTWLLYGKINRRSGWLKMEQPRFEPTITGVAQSSLHAGRIVPLYPCSGKLNQTIWRKVMDTALQTALAELPELYPPEFLREHGLLDRQTAVRNLHFPADEKIREASRLRLAFDEALQMQLAIARRRAQFLVRAQNSSIKISPELDQRIRRLFPFRPTAAQEHVIKEISIDLIASAPMQRLLQGDVGSGKTAVAFYAILAAVANGGQACLMAPTAVVAAQHFLTLETFLSASKQSRLRYKLLISGIKKNERAILQAELRAGGIDILITTHAVIEDDIQFKQLTLAVIDEQHKFGVAQRAALSNKGAAVNVLVMTATPIPRSLALTVYGDLEVSVINELPPGRQKIRSTIIKSARLPAAFDFLRAEIAKGRQAFIVSPLREENEDYLSAVEAFEKFRTHELSGIAVGLLHGQMNRDEQRQIMDDFHKKKLQVLVCTVVIEVGIDVPNANVMLVLHAERFGLAQLHQLRGRIGRGYESGHFIMLAGDGETAQQRLRVIAETTDGFKIAEADLRLRGPGEFLGVRQHGLPDFKVLDLLNDGEIVTLTRGIAKNILPELASPRFAELAKTIG